MSSTAERLLPRLETLFRHFMYSSHTVAQRNANNVNSRSVKDSTIQKAVSK